MKKFFQISILAILALLIFSCEDDDDRAVASLVSNPTLAASATQLKLEGSKSSDEAVAFTVGQADFGVPTGITSIVEFAKKGDNFKNSKAAQLPAGEGKLSFTHQEFNALVRSLGLEAGKAQAVEARVKSTIGSGFTPAYSNVVTLEVTPYNLTSYLYAPGDYQGWNPAAANRLVSETGNGIYEGLISFQTGSSTEFKITKDKNWDVNYGSNDGKTLVENGDNIKAPAKDTYKLTVNLNDMSFKFAKNSWGLIGSATPGGWDADTNMVWNDAKQVWELTLPLSEGEAKFRFNDDWAQNYGGNGLSGAAVAGGDNIAIISAGTYKVTLDEANKKYSFEKK